VDAKRTIPLPIEIPAGELRVHKIIVAHGAKEVCEQFSADNVYGSLGVSYEASPLDGVVAMVCSASFRGELVHPHRKVLPLRVGRADVRRISPLGPLGIGWHPHQCSDQAQQCLLFRSLSAAQEFAQLDVG